MSTGEVKRNREAGEAPPEDDVFRTRGSILQCTEKNPSRRAGCLQRGGEDGGSWHRRQQLRHTCSCLAVVHGDIQPRSAGGRRGAGSRRSAGEGHAAVQVWDKVLDLGLMAPPELSVLINQNLDVNFSSIHKFFIYHY